MNKKSYECYIGIDVSKACLDVSCSEREGALQFSNDEQGLKACVKKLPKKRKLLIVMEASGGYESNPAYYLRGKGLSVAIVNAKRVRDFARAGGKLAKTDRIDAQVIREYAEVFEPAAQAPVDRLQGDLTACSKRRHQLIQMLVMEKQHLELLKDAKIRKGIEQHIKVLKKALADLEARQGELIQSDAVIEEKVKRLEGIKGVGRITALEVIAELPELGQLTGKEVAALAGCAPFNKDSGTKTGKRETGGGRSALRAALYMAVLSAKSWNPPLKQFYDRLLAKGKLKKVAIVACIRKLVIIMNSMIRDGADWQPNLPNF
jgi:transposase